MLAQDLGILSFLLQLLRGLSGTVMGGRDAVIEVITLPSLCSLRRTGAVRRTPQLRQTRA